MVIVRLYGTDYEDQGNMLRELLCREIFGAENPTMKDIDIMPSTNRLVFSFVLCAVEITGAYYWQYSFEFTKMARIFSVESSLLPRYN